LSIYIEKWEAWRGGKENPHQPTAIDRWGYKQEEQTRQSPCSLTD